MNDFLCLCPFHGNTDTPSFSVSKESGKFLCFNMTCAESGSLLELTKMRLRKNDFEAMRIIAKGESANIKPFTERFAETLEAEEMPVFDEAKVDKMVEDFWASPEAVEYMRNRGFTDDILRSFKIGYSVKKRSIATPMYSIKGKCVGVIGRSLVGKSFDNSKRLPVRQTMWNIHRAIRTGSSTVIVCESAFDAMMLAQAGYTNVVACLGGNFNKFHEQQLMMHFDAIIIFTDWDNTDLASSKRDKGGAKCRKCYESGYKACKGHNAGRDTGEKIAKALRGKRVMWASYDYKMVYARSVKDACDMTVTEIRQCIQNAVTNLEYQRWGPPYYQKDLAKPLAISTSNMV